MYRCARCNEPVEMVDGAIVRTCGHDGEGVIADIQAVTVGVGDVQDGVDQES